MKRLAVVVPCYNEEAVLPETSHRLIELLTNLVAEKMIASNSYVMLVDNGSFDKTWELIKKYHDESQFVKGISLSINAGHQGGLLAGLSTVVNHSDMTITIDADLQDDVSAIREMVLKFNEGCDIVYGVRSCRKSDSFMKRFTAQSFYKIMNHMGAKSVYNHADYRLLSQRAVKHLLQFKEKNLYLRGIVPLLGYKSTCVYYERAERFAGESKYPISKLFSFAFEGITSFSVKPVHMVFWLGTIFMLVALCAMVWVVYALSFGIYVQGWASMMISIWFCSGCVLMGLGIVGEYIGKIYIEVKDRPRYNITEILMDNID